MDVTAKSEQASRSESRMWVVRREKLLFLLFWPIRQSRQMGRYLQFG